MSSISSKKREEKIEKIRKDFGYKKPKKYIDYLRENARLGDKESEKVVREFNRKKGRVCKFNIE